MKNGWKTREQAAAFRVMFSFKFCTETLLFYRVIKRLVGTLFKYYKQYTVSQTLSTDPCLQRPKKTQIKRSKVL